MATATDEVMARILGQSFARGPLAPATPSRQANIEKAKASGDFEAKRQKYNSDAAAMGSPTYMDTDGNITERKLNPADILQMTAQMSGGNTVSSRPEVAQRLLAMNIQNAGRARAGREAVDIATADQQAMADINSPVQRLAKNLTYIPNKYGVATAFSGTQDEIRAFDDARRNEILIAQDEWVTQRKEDLMKNLTDEQLAKVAAGGAVENPEFSEPSLSRSLKAAWAVERSKKEAEQAAKQAAQPATPVAAAPTAGSTPVATAQPDARVQAIVDSLARVRNQTAQATTPAVQQPTLETIPGLIPRATATIGAVTESAKDLYENRVAGPLRELFFGVPQMESKLREEYLKKMGIKDSAVKKIKAGVSGEKNSGKAGHIGPKPVNVFPWADMPGGRNARTNVGATRTGR